MRGPGGLEDGKVEAWLHGTTKNQQQRKRGSTSTNAWG